MTGSRPNIFILVCWKFITPAVIIFILITDIVMSIIKGTKDEGIKYSVYDKKTGDYDETEYQPVGIVVLGYMWLILIVMWVPIQAILA